MERNPPARKWFSSSGMMNAVTYESISALVPPNPAITCSLTRPMIRLRSTNIIMMAVATVSDFFRAALSEVASVFTALIYCATTD